jgi:hypothetical protein
MGKGHQLSRLVLARTDALMPQAETGKIALRPSSPLGPVVTRCVRDDNGVPRIWFSRADRRVGAELTLTAQPKLGGIVQTGNRMPQPRLAAAV